MFRRLGVFVGGASRRGGRVRRRSRRRRSCVVLDRLLDKSLVRAERTPAGTRYSMLQTLQDYAAERLASRANTSASSIATPSYYADLLAGALKGLVGHHQADWLATIGRERENIDAARESAIAGQDAQLALELVTPLGWYFYMTGELEPGADAFADALACPGPTEPGLRALPSRCTAGWCRTVPTSNAPWRSRRRRWR